MLLVIFVPRSDQDGTTERISNNGQESNKNQFLWYRK